MEKLIDMLDKEVKSGFMDDIEVVIRQMDAMSLVDPESALIYLIDASHRISKLQLIALCASELKINDII